MKRFQNILMVYNGKEDHQPALAHVIALAERTGARLTLVDVVEDLGFDSRLIRKPFSFGSLRTELLNERREQLEASVRAIAGNRATIAAKVLTGNAPIAIIREVLSAGHDLVVKSAVGPDTGFGSRLFGSTAIKLMRKCPVPVWAIKPSPEIRFRKILAAVDPTSSPDGDDRLNDLIVSLAGSIARSEGAHLHVLHCWRLQGESLLSSGRTRIPETAFNDLLEESERQTRLRFDKLIQSPVLEGVDVEVHLQRGHVGLIMPAFIEAEGIDLVVMGTLSRTGVAGLIAGNTAEKVFYSADCSVLAVKPPDFVSPVTL
jgi:nucleotide-binding universal stress UspA family protein